MTNTAGEKVYDIPKCDCDKTGGCEKCMEHIKMPSYYSKSIASLTEEVSREEERQFYEHIMKTNLL